MLKNVMKDKNILNNSRPQQLKMYNRTERQCPRDFANSTGCQTTSFHYLKKSTDSKGQILLQYKKKLPCYFINLVNVLKFYCTVQAVLNGSYN